MFFRASVVVVCAGIVGAVVRDREPECTASSFSRDLGNTHCPALAPHPTATAPDGCAAACCSLGDACQTWQWCGPGKACATGFWHQPGALARGDDVPGWPRNTTVAAAEAACESDPKCAGITYHSQELRPRPNQIFKFYLKTADAGPVGSLTWSRHVKAKPGCFVGRLDDECECRVVRVCRHTAAMQQAAPEISSRHALWPALPLLSSRSHPILPTTPMRTARPVLPACHSPSAAPLGWLC